jgi:hypothetical protein
VGAGAARAVAVLAAALVLAAPAVAAPPARGVLVPGESLGGVRLGMTKAQVREAWGSAYGRCRGCFLDTWYFNYRPFAPQGAGVAFQRGRVSRVFTLWQPPGWRTTKGLALGASQGEVTRTYGALAERLCSGYTALVMPRRRAQTVFYVDEGTLWGFGLTRPGSSPCV